MAVDQYLNLNIRSIAPPLLKNVGHICPYSPLASAMTGNVSRPVAVVNISMVAA
jgi:hypothetical protein